LSEEQQALKEWKLLENAQIQEFREGKASLQVSVLVNKEHFGNSLIDSGCQIYAMIDHHFANRYKLPRLSIPPRTLNAIHAPTGGRSMKLLTPLSTSAATK
jgi:hypothetical protein